MNPGRIDVHSHLIPGVDDGCQTLAESIQCGRELVRHGYSHVVCTPHTWSSLDDGTDAVRSKVRWLQREMNDAAVPLTLMPGGELTFAPDLIRGRFDGLPTYGLAGKAVLIDLWVDRLPGYFEPAVRWLQGHGVQVILAHPERMAAVQDDPDLVDYFADLGLLLQGNLQCLADPPHLATRRTADLILSRDRYYMLGTDLHRIATLPIRMAGLRRAIEVLGDRKADELTIHHPATILGLF